MKVLRWLDLHFEEAILVFLLVVIACVELAQVVCRNVPFLPALTWAEELCRFAWIATVFLSLPYTVRTSNMLRVSVLIDSLPDYLHNLLNIVVDVVTAAMMGVLGWASISVVQRIFASGETSPAMLWPMWIMYAIVTAGFVLAALRSVQMIVIHIIHFNERPITYVEEQMEAEVAQEWVRPATISGADPIPVADAATGSPGAGSSPGAAASVPEGAPAKGGDE
ncbi:MAG: TRAP transporter small permease [Coriobacteriia bacterium]|nr:TRAP transporter small permease [Coriobacteriia bacterium]